jgi:hypothetical protein
VELRLCGYVSAAIVIDFATRQVSQLLCFNELQSLQGFSAWPLSGLRKEARSCLKSRKSRGVAPKTFCATAAIGMSRHNSMVRASKKRKPLPSLAQGAATFKTPCPGIAARHPRFQESLVLEEVQMPPAFRAGVNESGKAYRILGSKNVCPPQINHMRLRISDSGEPIF